MSGARVRRLRFCIGFAAALLLAVPLPAAASEGIRAAGLAAERDSGAAAATGWIVTLKHDARVDQASTIAKAAGGRSGRVFEHALHGFVFRGTAAAAAKLRHNPNVRTVVPDGKVTITADTIPTGISRIRADHPTDPSAYQSGFTGRGVKVAILDTGIDLTHPDLVPNLDIALGKNCITSGPPQDGHGHGTHVAGTVAAADNGIGVIGVAPEATLVPIKVLDDTGSGEWSNLICAIDYLTGLINDADPTNDVRVANMSLGDVGSVGSCTDGFVREAICNSVAAGIVYVAAAGNSTVDVSTFIPAAYPEVIAVSALTDLDGERGGLAPCYLLWFYCDDTLAEYSNYGAGIAVTAPGTQIYSDWTGGGYATEMGTSMASPHVAGVAALVLAANPSLTPDDVAALLKSTGECPNGAFADTDGSGTCADKGQWTNDPDGIAEPLVNALQAVNGSGPGNQRPVVHFVTPTSGAIVSAPVAITATATDAVGVTQVQFAADGVPLSTDTDGSNGWSATWSPNVDGISYRLSATATNTNGLTATSSITVSTSSVQGNWVGTYGHDGYILANWDGANTDLSSLPAGVTYSLEVGGRANWAATTTDVRALTNPAGTARQMRTWYDINGLRLRLNFSTAYSGTLHLYAVDWDAYGGNRYQNVTVDDGSGPRVASIASSFVQGAWVHAPISVAAGGSVVISVDKTGGYSAVLAGLFLGGPSTPPPPTVPGAPTGLAATPGNGQVALAWTAPASNGGSAITGYTATASPGGATCTSATPGCTIGSLTNGTTYSFTVTATNAVGTGPASAPVSAKPATVPGAPRNVKASRNQTKGVTLTWTAPSSNGGSLVTGYRIYRSTTSGTETFLVLVGNVSTYVDAATTRGARYYYQLTAVNGIGEGPRSAQTSAVAR